MCEMAAIYSFLIHPLVSRMLLAWVWIYNILRIRCESSEVFRLDIGIREQTKAFTATEEARH